MASENLSRKIETSHNVLETFDSATELPQAIKEVTSLAVEFQHIIPQMSHKPKLMTSSAIRSSLSALQAEINRAEIKCEENGGTLDDKDFKIVLGKHKTLLETLVNAFSADEMKQQSVDLKEHERRYLSSDP